MRGLRASLAFGLGQELAFAALVGAAILLWALSVQLEMTKRQLRQASLDTAARNIAQHLVVDPAGNGHLLPREASASMGYPTVVFDRDGHVVYQRPAQLDPATVDALSRERLAPADQRHRLGTIRFFSLTLGAKHLVGAALHAGSGPDARAIVVFKDENAPDVLINEVLSDFPYSSLVVILPLLLALLAAGAVIVRRRLQPITLLSRQAQTIGLNTLDRRLPERDVPAEMQPIVRAFNDVLGRLEQAVEAQRELLRRAAHQLRTPMMLLNARAAQVSEEATAAELRADVAELARIVGQLQQLNEVDALPAGGKALADLGAVAAGVRDELTPRAAKQGMRLDLSRPEAPVLVHGDPYVIEVALRNLVENALDQSPAARTVTVAVGSDGDIAVSDNGPGVAEELRDKIFEPLWSGDPDGRRIGLGLTIVRRIAERYGAGIAVETAATGGARFVLHFTVAPTTAAVVEAAALAPARVRLGRRWQHE